jgi:hypothetical protein
MWHEPSTVAHGQEMKRQSVENPSQMRRVPEYTDEASDEEFFGTFKSFLSLFVLGAQLLRIQGRLLLGQV